MAYIEKQDLVDALGPDKLLQLTDDENTESLDDAGVNKVIDQVISFAVGTFDSYARTRYTLPVPVTEKVRATCLDLAIYRLQRRRSTSDEGVLKVAKQGYDDAIKFLEAIQKGTAALDVPAAEETKTNPASSDEVLRGSSRPSPFSDEKLRNF